MTSSQPLRDKTALVIGGSRGIGRAVTERLAADGAAVCFSYVHQEVAARTVAEGVAGRGGRALPFQADLRDLASVRRLFDEAQKRLGGLDIVVVNAGVVVIKPVVELTEDDYEMIRTRLTAVPPSMFVAGGDVAQLCEKLTRRQTCLKPGSPPD